MSALIFQRLFSRFEKAVRHHSDGESFTSFREGFPAEWEDYKEDVRKEAIIRLEYHNWKQADVGEGRILDRVIKSIEIYYPAPRKLRNNLVAWKNRWGDKNLSHRELLQAKSDVVKRRNFEQWFLDFFQGRLDDGEAFESFRQLAGGRYDLVAYLFFLKDWKRFMPISPTNFDEAFRLLKVDLLTAHHCSWENYVRYNAALLEVQRALQDVAEVADARLVDAHSFCWMLVKLKLPAPSSAVVIPLPVNVKGLKALALQSKASTAEIEFEIVTDEQFAKKAAEQRRIGRLAQDVALQSERRRLREAGHKNPEQAVRPVWDEPARGYDILSSGLDGTPRHIEVKAAQNSGQRLSFFLTRNEWMQSRSLPNYYLYLVLNAQSKTPSIIAIESGDISAECLTPMTYLASFVGLSV